MKFKSNFKVITPATIANLACGLDILGVALEQLKDELIVKTSDQPGIHISTIFNNKAKIPLETEKNAAGVSAQLTLDFLKEKHHLDKQLGLDFSINKKVPVGHGLGSSSASAVAGAFAVNEAFGCPLTKRELIPFIVQGEQLAEKRLRINSLIPALLGGVILTKDHQSLDFHRLPLVRGLHFVVIYPHNHPLHQTQVRNNLPKKISVSSSIQQSANTASLVQAFYTSNLDLLSRSLVDHIAEQHWSGLTPFFKEIKEAALNNKALGCSIAGAGSGIFALCKNSLEAEQAAEAMQNIYTAHKIRHTIIVSKIDQEGVSIA